MKRLIAVLFFTVFFTGCTVAPPLNFSLQDVDASEYKFDGDLKSLTVVIGNPNELLRDVPPDTHLIVSEWQNAVQNAVDRAVIFNDNSERRVNLSVKILGLEIPGSGLDMTARAIARYDIIDRHNGGVVFSTVVDSTETVPFGEEFQGVVRARESVNRAIQGNIREFLDRLKEEAKR